MRGKLRESLKFGRVFDEKDLQFDQSNLTIL
jgi:hypothetical protein